MPKKTGYRKDRDRSQDPETDYMLCMKYGIEYRPHYRKPKPAVIPSALDSADPDPVEIRQTVLRAPAEIRKLPERIVTPSLSKKFRTGDRGLNIDELSTYYMQTGTIQSVELDRRLNWGELDFKFSPTIITIELDTGETIRAHEQYWYPLREK